MKRFLHVIRKDLVTLLRNPSFSQLPSTYECQVQLPHEERSYEAKQITLDL